MSYLQPPPNSSPVVVVKDVGGYVNEYAAMTEIYRRTNREVRLHECRSACTMALGLPNVCVYPNSILKFHQAYDPRNHETNWAVSDQLFGTYPSAIRARLGTLTKQYTVMRGQELIDLGMRNCDEPQGPRIMVAQATLKPLPETGALATLTGRLEGMMPNATNPPGGARTVTPLRPERLDRAAPVPDGMLAAVIPLPPERPGSLSPDTGAPWTASVGPNAGAPLPPPRPRILVAYTPGLPPIPMIAVIDGSQSILPARFVPFPARRG